MKKLLLSSLIAITIVTIALADYPGTLTKVGDVSPVTSVVTVDGKTVDFKGKVVVLVFWATWCGPCQQEMPHIESDLWKPLKDKGLVVIACGRNHSVQEVTNYQKSKPFTFMYAADPQRTIYGKFASQYIPRSVLIGKDGRIKYQMVTGGLDGLINTAKTELAK